MNSETPGKPSRQSVLRQFALAMDLPFVLIGGVVAGGGLGYLLDRWLHTSPLFTVVLGLFGFAGGVWEVLRLVAQPDKKAGKDDDAG